MRIAHRIDAPCGSGRQWPAFRDSTREAPLMLPQTILTDVTADDLQALLTNQVAEGRTLDYKRDFAIDDKAKRELTKDVSSFANAAGGDLIFGIEEAKDADGQNLGIPEKVMGVAVENLDKLRQWIDSVVRDGIDPRVPHVSVHAVTGDFERGPCIIIRVGRSTVGPHMQANAGPKTLFFSRNNSGVHPLDVREIRSAFLHSADLADRVRRFRDDRISKIVAGDLPLLLAKGPVFITHVVPLASAGETDVDVASFDRRGHVKLTPPYTAPNAGFSGRFTLDGYVTFTGGHGQQQTVSYSFIFRDGSFEAVTSGALRPGQGGGVPRFYPFHFEATAVRAAEAGVKLLREQGVSVPLVLLCSAIGLKGSRIAANDDYEAPFRAENLIERDIITLPDVLVSDPTVDARVALKDAFDVLWQGGGFDRSYGYSASGATRNIATAKSAQDGPRARPGDLPWRVSSPPAVSGTAKAPGPR